MNFASFRGDARLSTWLARIVLNEAIRRRQRRRDTVPIEPLDIVQVQSDMQTR
jgi:RNA polymerase sigma-70 factor (ECF subfamily)